MKLLDVIVARTPKGGYKAYFWGQPDNHLMDWLGCNYRIISVPGQPLRGFATEAGAAAFARKAFPTHAMAALACFGTDGSFMKIEKFTALDYRTEEQLRELAKKERHGKARRR